MPTDAQTLCNIIATEGYDKLSKRALLEAILAAVATGGGGGACAAQSGAGSPVGSATPAFVGQLYHDTTADAYYRSTGLTVGDWTVISSGAWNFLTETGPMDFSVGDSTIAGAVVFSNLIGDGGNTGIGFQFCANITSLSFLSLLTASYSLVASNNPLLTFISATQLGMCGAQNPGGPIFTVSSNPNLTNISMPNMLSKEGSLDFSGNALNAASVELLLSRFVASGLSASAITLGGGTNAGLASLSVQGQADAATLGAQLTINP